MTSTGEHATVLTIPPSFFLNIGEGHSKESIIWKGCMAKLRLGSDFLLSIPSRSTSYEQASSVGPVPTGTVEREPDCKQLQCHELKW